MVITRPLKQAGRLAQELRARASIVISLPLVRIEPPLDSSHFDSALRDLNQFDWVIFASQNAVAAVADRLSAVSIDVKSLPDSLQVAAVGKVTAAVASQAGFKVGRVGKGTAAQLVSELAPDLRGKSVFLPRSDRAAAALFAQVQQAGARAIEVCAYRTVASDRLDPGSIAATASADAILFFSPSAAHVFLDLLRSEALPPLCDTTAVGAIGPVTEAALREAGMRCDFVSSEPSDEKIVSALAGYFQNRTSPAGAHSR